MNEFFAKRRKVLQETVDARVEACRLMVRGVKEDNLELSDKGRKMHTEAIKAAQKVRF